MSLPVDYTCCLCSRVAREEDLTDDPRWAEPVHKGCILTIERWSGKGHNPKGIYGDGTLSYEWNG